MACDQLAVGGDEAGDRPAKLGQTMKKARLTEEQIIGILQEHEAGAKCADLCRKHGMSEAQEAQPDRDHVRQAEGLAPHCNPLRQLSEGLPLHHRSRGNRHVLALTINQSEA